MKIAIALQLSTLLVSSAAAASEHSGAPRPDAPLTVTPLNGGVYWVSGGVSTSGFVIGKNGVIVIDAQMFAPAARTVIREIARLTPKPIDALIVTHSDPDHSNGLPAYPAGIRVIAQKNARSEMIAALADPKPAFTSPPPALKDYLPTRIVGRRAMMTIDGELLELLHVAPAHTDGDLLIFLPRQKIVFAGDVLTPAAGPYPVIHLEKHGSSLGWIRTVRAMLGMRADIFVPGHGAPMTRADVEKLLAATEQRRSEIAALVRRKKTLDEIKAQLRDTPGIGLAARFPTFIETTYRELTTPSRP